MSENKDNKILLEVKNLKKYFSTPTGNLHAVDNVSFTIEEGKTLGMVGESGCGKSTTGRTILRLLEPTDGEIIFDGVNITKLPSNKLRDLRSRMQLIFQDPYSSLDPRMSIAKNIAEPLIIHKTVIGRKKIEEKVRELMDMVELSARVYNAYPNELDGGRRQRVGIARALSLNPQFIVCDEPVSALDVSVQAQILNLLQDLQDKLKLTYLFVTHDMSVVKHISDDIVVMYLGETVEKCDADELFKHQYHPYTKALISAIPIPEIGEKKKTEFIKGEIFSPIEPKNACRFAERCNFAKDICYNENPDFREIKPNRFVACHFAENM
jgi:peptide/nickel transport system ATP-binding protein